MPITSHDVARLAGVSQPTVSRALRGDPRISATTREKVEAAARALGYVPSEAGRSLSTRSTRQVAMVADLSNQLYPALVPTLHDTLGAAGYRLVLLAERTEQDDVLGRLLDRSVDGVLLTTTFLDSPLPAELRRHRVPFVYLNRIGELAPGDAASVDNRGGAAAAGRLLVGLGHTRVAAIFGAPSTSTGRDRETGFREALAEAGVPLPARRVRQGWFDHEHGEQGLRDLLAGGSRFTALFCGNDFIAVGAMAEAERHGIRVPDDLAVVGFDDLPMAAWPWLQLTTVRSPLAALAADAVHLLLRRLAGPDAPPEHRVHPAELVLRRSHGSPLSTA